MPSPDLLIYNLQKKSWNEYISIIANQMTPGVFQSTGKESSNLLATIEYWNQMHIDMHVEVTKWNCIWCRQKLKKLLLWCHEEIWNLWWKAKFPIDNLFDSVPKKVHDCITQLFEVCLMEIRWGSRTDWLKIWLLII